MKITWKRCNNYEEVQDYSRIIYLHEWNERSTGERHTIAFSVAINVSAVTFTQAVVITPVTDIGSRVA